MKRLVHLFLTFVALAVSMTAVAQSTRIEVGTASSSTNKAPFSNDKKFATVQMIYPASQIELEGSIDTLWFHCANAGEMTHTSLKIYLGHTQVATSSAWIPADEVTLVYDNTDVSGTSVEGWVPLVLQTPFEYNGVDNLVVIVASGRSAAAAGITFSSYSSAGSVLSRSAALASAINAYPPSGTTTSPADLPIVRLSLRQNDCPRPSRLAVSNITANSATLSWEGEGSFELHVTGNDYDETHTVATNSYTLEDLTPLTTYQAEVRRVCQEGFSSWATLQFTTSDQAATLPFSCSFEDDEENALWTLSNGSSTNRWTIGDATQYGDGTHSLYISNDNGTTNAYTFSNAGLVFAQRLVTIENRGDYTVAFDWKQNGASRSHFRVALVPASATVTPTTTSSSATFPTGSVALDTSRFFNSSEWSHFEWMTARTIEAGNYYLTFAWANTGGSTGENPPAAIDNVELHAVTCPNVDSLFVSNINANTADLRMVNSGEGEDYMVVVYADGSELRDTLYVASPYTLEGLAANTLYHVTVYTDCGDEGTSLRGKSATFTTLCGLVEGPPFAEDFDNTQWQNNRHPDCWNIIDDANSTYQWGRTSSNTHSGNYALQFTGSASTSSNDWISTPRILLNGGQEMVLWLKGNGANANVTIAYTTGECEDHDTYQTLTTINVNHLDWKRYIISLAEVAEEAYLLIGADGNVPTFYVDDLMVRAASTCPEILSISTNNITSEGATISWTLDNQVTIPVAQYNISLTRRSTTTTFTTTNTSYTFSGLRPSSTYSVTVEAVCEEGSSSITTEFETPCQGGHGTIELAGSGENHQIPVNNYYNYTYTEMLYLASELNMGATVIDSIAFQYTSTLGNPSKTNVSIYLGTTNATTIGSTWNYNANTFTLVYTGSLACTGAGWKTIHFDTPFVYDGVSNLIVAIDDNSNGYDDSYQGGYIRHNFGYQEIAGRTLTYCNDYSNPAPGATTVTSTSGTTTAITPSQLSFRTSTRFFGGCSDEVLCAAPSVTVDEVDEVSATLSWTPGLEESSWRVEYRAAGETEWTVYEEEWGEQAISINDLEANTAYTARITSLCFAEEEEEYVDVHFHTMAYCPTLNGLRVTSTETNTLSIAWNMDNTYSNATPATFTVEVLQGSTPIDTYDAFDNNYTIENLEPSTSYTIKVHAECENGSTDTIQITATTAEYIDPSSFLYYFSFDNASENAEWTLNNGTASNKWVIGNAVCHSGSSSIYVSNDNGTSNAYTITSAATVYAYHPVTFDQTGEYQCRFDWNGKGENRYDYLNVMLTNRTDNLTALASEQSGLPNGAVSLHEAEHLEMSTDWTTEVYNFTIDAPGTYYLALRWRNDGSVGTNPPAAVDNIIIRAVALDACSAPASAVAIVTGARSAQVSISGTADEYAILFKATTAETYDTILTTDSLYTFANLDYNTNYEGLVASVCDDGTFSGTRKAFEFYIEPLTIYLERINFENPEINANWIFSNATAENKWCIGSAVNNGGTHALYISNDNGTSHTYTTSSSSSSVYAAYPITIPASGTFTFKFDWEALGEMNFDYMRVALVPASTVLTGAASVSTFNLPAGGHWLDGGLNLYGQNFWSTRDTTITLNLTQPTDYKIVFWWRNDGSAGNNPPAAIDNIAVIINDMEACTRPSMVEVTKMGNDYVLSATHFSSNNFMMVWKDDASATFDTTYFEESHTFNNIPAMHSFSGIVYTECGEGEYSTEGREFSFNTIPPATIPFNEDFESPENGWQFANGNQTNRWIIDTATHTDGQHALYISNNGHDNAYTTSGTQTSYAYRTIALNAGSYILTFDWKNNGESTDYLKAYLLPEDFTPSAGFTDLSSSIALSGTLYNSSDWTSFRDYVDIAQSGTYKLAFQWHNDSYGGSQSPAAVDNIQLVPETCHAPAAIEVADITFNSAVITISDSTIDSVMLLYKEHASTAWDTLYGSLSFELSGLTTETTYDVKAYTICDDGFASRNATDYTFNTLCGTITELPWTCGFENLTWLGTATSGSTQYPKCWSATNVANPNSYWYKSTATRRGGFTSAGFLCNTVDTATRSNDKLITPAIQLTGNEELTFYVAGVSRSLHSRMSVQYSADLVTFTALPVVDANRNTLNIVDVNTNSFQQFSVSLEGIEGDIYLAFVIDTNSASLFLDDLKVGERAACLPPTNVALGDVASTSASFVITDADNSEWTIFYRANNDTLQSLVVNTLNPTLTGLTPNTSYSYYIKANCQNGGFSDPTSTQHFTTSCSDVDLPFAENFEDWDNSCWKLLPLANRFTTSSDAFQGTHSLSISGSATSPAYLVTPPLAESINTLMVSMAVRSTSAATIRICAMTDNTNTSSATSIQTIPTSSEWQIIEVPLAAYQGTGRHLAICAEGNVTIDSLLIINSNGCARPFGINATSISDNSMALTWNANGSSSFDVEYGVQGFTHGDGTMLQTETNSILLADLESNTHYDIYVRSRCSSSQFSEWQKATFATERALNRLPFTCNFSTDNDMWTLDNGTEPNQWHIGTTGGRQGSGLFVGNSSYTTSYTTDASATVFAYCPIYIPAGALQIQFDWKCHGESTFDYARAALVPADQTFTPGTTPSSFGTTNLPTGWIALDGGSKLNLSANDNWTTKNATATVAVAGIYKLVFVWHNDNSDGVAPAICIDNISIDIQREPCHTPTAIQVAESSNSADLTWNGNGLAYEIGWRKTTETNYLYAISTTNSFSITGLQQNTGYTYSLRQICDINDTSEAVFGTFTTTEVVCPTATGLHVETYTRNSALVVWDANPDVLRWETRFSDGTSTRTDTVTTTSYTYTNLQEEHTYTFNVRALCSYDITGDWSDDLTIFIERYVCPMVTGLAVQNQDETSATVVWDQTPGIFRWEVDLYSGDNHNITTVNVPHASFSELEAGTVYSVAVRSICDDSTYSDWCSPVAIYIQLGDECPPVDNITFSDITTTSVTVDWSSVPVIDRWQIQYGVHGFTLGNGLINTVGEHPQTLRNLQPNTQYDLYIRSVCSSSNFSEWSPVATFSTLNTQQGIDQAGTAMMVAIYPNPASESATISISGAQGDIEVSVLDLSGREVAHEHLYCDADCTHTLDVTNLIKGTYFVRIQGSTFNNTQKLIIY